MDYIVYSPEQDIIVEVEKNKTIDREQLAKLADAIESADV